jgi:hypothetical protein
VDEFNTVQITMVMRGDPKVGDQVTLPPTRIIKTSAAARSAGNQNVSFQVTFQIARIRHVGNFRQPDATAPG